MRRRIIIIGLFLMCLADIYAQKLNVESFVAKTNDITARTQPRQDINGNDCDLVKVQLAAPNAVFEGNVIGDVAYNTSEYLVYMAQGSKKLTVKLEGYLPLEVGFSEYGINSLEGKTVYVLTLSGVTGTQQLEAPKTKTGWIILDSEPSGASVYINDEFVGNTPLSNYKQAYGTYQYRLESLNYHPATGTIELNSGRYEQKLVLKPAFGSISVKSSIAGAKIVLDGKQTGKQTPTTLTEIPSGTHTITLQMDKYAPKQQEVIVEDEQTANVSMALDARFARITINTLDGADIYSNGKLLGKGRISEDMMEGYYDIEVRLDHHQSVTKQIQVVAGQSQDITLNPIPKYGSLDIISEPHNATITIDGKVVGKSPLTINEILEGEHTIQLSLEKYKSETKKIVVTNKQSEPLQFYLHIDTPLYYYDLGKKSFEMKEYRQAAKYYKIAAEQGYSEAQLDLGYLYKEGLGLTKDLKEASKWYKLAANQGLPEAQYQISHMYFLGDGVTSSLSETIKWLRKSADQGYAAAEYLLGYFYECGIGVPKSNKQAQKWYELAAKHGDKNALKTIKGLK